MIHYTRLQLDSLYHNSGIRFYIDRIYIGLDESLVQNDKAMNQLFSQIRNIQQLGIKAVFVFPVMDIKHQSFVERLINQFGRNNICPDEYVVNDKPSYEFLCNRVSVPIALGRNINIISGLNLNEHSSNNERNSIISRDNRAWITNRAIAYIMCDMPYNGLWIASQESSEIKIVLPEKMILEMGCNQSWEDDISFRNNKKGKCTGSRENYKKIVNSIIENRAEIIISLATDKSKFENQHNKIYKPENSL